MRVLILGGAGMLGHQLWRELHHRHEVWVTLRQPPAPAVAAGLFDAARTLTGIDAADDGALAHAFAAARPDAVINCVGVVKQRPEAADPLVCIPINALLPHRLARLAATARARLIHISTDCVFSGHRGGYTEADPSDAEDLYGRSKFLGEVHGASGVTLRTSIIGRELQTRSGLIEWFLAQQGRTIRGFRRAVYSGLTTLELARVIERVLVQHPGLQGLWHVSGQPINKYELLRLAQRAFAWTGEIVPDDTLVCDRTLDSTRFRDATGYRPPAWSVMLDELARVPPPRPE